MRSKTVVTSVSPTLAYAALPRGPKVAVRACFPQWELPARMALTALLGGPEGMSLTWNRPPGSAAALRVTWSLADIAVAALFAWLYRRAERSRA